MFPILNIGPAAIQTAGLILIASVWVGISLAEKRAHLHGLRGETLDNILLPALIGFIVGGRLAYVLANLPLFRATPIDIISIDPTLFDMFGGLAAALLVGWIYANKRETKLELWPLLDALTPFFATLAVGLGAAHLASGAAFGAETSLPWGIELHGVTRHPSQVYEVAAALFILNLTALRPPFVIPGKQFLAWVAWTAGAALFLGAFRGDSVLIFNGVRLGQVSAWIALACAFLGMEQLQKRSQRVKARQEEHG